MTADESMNVRFFDVHLSDDAEHTITYRSGLVVYQESLTGGQFVGRGWNGSGATNTAPERLDPAAHPAPQSFWVELDGQLLRSHWEWSGLEIQRRDDDLEAVVSLRHAHRPVTVRVHTLLDGTAVLTRWLDITHDGDKPAALSAAYPWCGVLNKTSYDIDSPSPYGVGYFQDTHWGNEGAFSWHDLPRAGYRIDGRYRRDRHRHPFFVVRNRVTGEHFVGTLGWSGGYCFEFDVDDGQSREESRLWFRAGPDAPAPLRVVDPGETVTTPQMHLGMVIGDLDACVQALHEHLRSSVLYEAPDDRACLIEAGIGPEQGVVVDEIMHNLEIASAIGAEVFFLDAEWYAPPGGNWWASVGDWQVDRQRFPQGLAPIREAVHDRGMLFGLWMDAERIGVESRLAAEHPDWYARRYDGKPELGGMIDLVNPEAADWLGRTIGGLIEGHKLEFSRLDYNVGNIGAGSQTIRSGYVENGYWRYYEALYGMYARLRVRFPRVVFENCASGGARTDVGMIRPFNHTWVTDWQIAPRSFSITNGMTMALPPERIDRLGGGMGQWLHRTGELEFHNRLALFVHQTVGWTHMLGTVPNPIQIERIRHATDIYKQFVRPYHRSSRIYHHTPEVKGFDPCGWGVLELASSDRTKSMIGLFRLSDPAEETYGLRLRGISRSGKYRVTFDNSGDTIEMDGVSLVQQGLLIRLEAPLTSELLLVEALE